ncbi:MAG: glycine cleavage system aminomethyltransferase GcvT [Gammaproteobacteria bacterium]|nr:glycine cleavage system aminomethyltransferase GcvT [Gammaproteobacteria bacterium]
MGHRTPLYETHVHAGAKMVDFGGWDMPLHYGSQIDEHHRVRQDAGMFDVSHMSVFELQGEQVRDFLRLLLANDIGKLRTPGKALYSCLLNKDGGVIDDLIVYYLNENWFRVVANAGTREKDLNWVHNTAQLFGGVQLVPRDDVAMIAVQGPNAKQKVYTALGAPLRAAAVLPPFHAATIGDYFVATTGYTGEEGFEIILPRGAAVSAWQALIAAGVAPIGLGARDTLRLEAGMNLYGLDMDESTTPLEAGLSWTVGFEPKDRKFIGRQTLDQQRTLGAPRQLVGLVLEEKGVLRSHQQVVCDGFGRGEITSGSFSPTLNRSIALARVPAGVPIGSQCQVDIRGKLVPARVVKYPFVRQGKSCLS